MADQSIINLIIAFNIYAWLVICKISLQLYFARHTMETFGSVGATLAEGWRRVKEEDGWVLLPWLL